MGFGGDSMITSCEGDVEEMQCVTHEERWEKGDWFMGYCGIAVTFVSETKM